MLRKLCSILLGLLASGCAGQEKRSESNPIINQTKTAAVSDWQAWDKISSQLGLPEVDWDWAANLRKLNRELSLEPIPGVKAKDPAPAFVALPEVANLSEAERARAALRVNLHYFKQDLVDKFSALSKVDAAGLAGAYLVGLESWLKETPDMKARPSALVEHQATRSLIHRLQKVASEEETIQIAGSPGKEKGRMRAPIAVSSGKGLFPVVLLEPWKELLPQASVQWKAKGITK